MRHFLFLCLMFVLCSHAVMAESFPDVSEEHKNYEAIEFLKDKGVVNGYPDGSFGPDDEVTRAQATKMILKSGGVTYSGLYKKGFDDVNKEDWFWEYVMVAASLDIVEGYEDGNFRPNQAVNLAENLKLIFTANEVELEESEEAVFADVPAGEWYSDSALYARDYNLLEPDALGGVDPGRAMTRAEFSELLYRFMVSKEEGKPFDIATNWDYLESNYFPLRLKVADSWSMKESFGEMVLFRKDEKFEQYDESKVFPNSGLIRVRIDPNEEKIGEKRYFSNLKSAFKNKDVQEFELDGMSGLEVVDSGNRLVDWYLYLEDQSVVMVYSAFGDGNLGFHIQKEIAGSLKSIEYKELDRSVLSDGNVEMNSGDLKISEVLEYVLVEGEGEAVLERVGDKVLIETDLVGVGTGPVDYFYSASLGYTLKYERSANVILDTRAGETSAF